MRSSLAAIWNAVRGGGQAAKFTCVNNDDKVTHMKKTQVYLRREEHEALRKAAAEDRHRS
jgi:hypothetical protein